MLSRKWLKLRLHLILIQTILQFMTPKNWFTSLLTNNCNWKKTYWIISLLTKAKFICRNTQNLSSLLTIHLFRLSWPLFDMPRFNFHKDRWKSFPFYCFISKHSYFIKVWWYFISVLLLVRISYSSYNFNNNFLRYRNKN